MTLGLDTSVVLRLLTGEPESQFCAARERLARAHAQGERVIVSDLVVAEAYYALQYHYEVPKDEARAALGDLVTSRLVELVPADAMDALDDAGGAGLVDRLIHARNRGEGALSLTFDRRFARLDGAVLLDAVPPARPR
jgi:predicted nucleic acid-binding protein